MALPTQASQPGTATRAQLLQSIATTIADYRTDSPFLPRGPAHVDKWVRQFDGEVQDAVLDELEHVLRQTYIPRTDVTQFLQTLCVQTDLASSWQAINLLRIQQRGSSQREMLDMFSGVLQVTHGLNASACGSPQGPYIYLDDAIFTGNRLLNDLRSWMPMAPAASTVHVVVIALHRGGARYAKDRIVREYSAAGKALDLRFRCIKQFDDGPHSVNADLVRPASLPNDAYVTQYVNSLQHAPVLRSGASLGENAVFKSTAGRDVLEQEFLKRGAYLRAICTMLPKYHRPLGNMVLQTLGFGSTVVTFRNCPNNCPLVFWAGDPWYPLFPRKNN